MKIAAILLCLVIGTVQCSKAPEWPSQYMVQGTLQLPYAEIVEPFSAFYDLLNNRSRIDYYGLMDVTIQLGATTKDPAGASYKVTYMTDDIKKIDNKRVCFTMAGSPLDPVGPQAILPDLKGFKFAGYGLKDSENCTAYQLITKVGNKKNTYTMWVSMENKPVRYEMMGYDSLLGSHYDKYILEYDQDSFITGKGAVPDSKFDVKKIPNVDKCQGFPGPGSAERRVLFNPMLEYITGHDAHISEGFDRFKHKHAKQYDGQTEEATRQHVFRQNLRFIHSMNRAGKSYRVAVNHLTDRFPDELKYLRGYRNTPGAHGGEAFTYTEQDVNDIPDYLDWRLSGAVTPVKDQAVCGSCWSFGTTGAVEGALFLKTGQLVRLSQQALMDCSWGEGNNACDGGEDFRAYEWILKHGLPSEEDYGQYLAADGFCHFKNVTATAKMSKYGNVPSGDLNALKVAMVNHGPISVAIDASHKSLSFYSNGVYYELECGNTPDDLDHAVLAVGYGVLDGEAYWLVKNSWSTYWGNDGYVLMAQKDNNCGVATDATYVLM